MMGICQQSLFVGLLASHLLFSGASASAGLLVTSLDTSTRLAFDSYRGDGFAPNPTSTQLDSDHWRILGLSDGAGTYGGTYLSGDFARGQSTGGVTTGGIYAFNVDAGAGFDWALGFQPIGSDLTPGAATLMVTNATGTIVDQLDLAYRVLVRNDGDRSSTFGFGYSSNDLDYEAIDSLQVTSTLLGDSIPEWTAIHRATRLSGLNLVSGASLFLQWQLDDLSGTGSRDEWALDDIELTFGSAPVSTVPEPASWILVGLLCPAAVWPRRRQSLASGRTPRLCEQARVVRRRLSALVEVLPLS